MAISLKKSGLVAASSLVGGILGAATGAASGAIGAKIFKALGYGGSSILEATRIGSAGNALLGLASGIAAYGVIKNGMFNNSRTNYYFHAQHFIACATEYFLHQIIGGLIGYNLFSPKTSWQDITYEIAIGGLVTTVPVTLLLCILAIYAAELRAGMVYREAKEEKKYKSISSPKPEQGSSPKPVLISSTEGERINEEGLAALLVSQEQGGYARPIKSSLTDSHISSISRLFPTSPEALGGDSEPTSGLGTGMISSESSLAKDYQAGFNR